jgi:hypothetical protein
MVRKVQVVTMELLTDRARSFYNASQEDFIDNVKISPITRSQRSMERTTSRTVQSA